MAFSVSSGQITDVIRYRVFGVGSSILYNSSTYYSGDTFQGVAGIKTFVVNGDATVQEVSELKGGAIEFVQELNSGLIYPDESTKIAGMAMEFELTAAEKLVQDVTKIQGFAIELIDYPFYSFMITETRL